ncbi:hypothetical protein [Borrelia sp. RT1S]|uniref:hypothetical protein n=1 Tax=Borrelia sp. RT1S TaxID=2898580 RepID=UPI001E2937C8|nr:hypothetical protein [Borrelia sp. RT1S]UGQ17758.1 hypothetical protein LSO05_04840 [Borrelia sp. RT1S]
MSESVEKQASVPLGITAEQGIGKTKPVAGVIEMSFIEYSSMHYQTLTKQIESVEKQIVGLENTMNAKFDTVDKQFDTVDKQFAAVNSQIASVNQRIDDVKNDINIRFEAVDKQFEAVDKQFLGVNQRINEVKNDIEEKMDTKINNLEKNIYRELAIMRKDFTNSNRILMASATLIFLLGVAFIPKVMAYLGM